VQEAFRSIEDIHGLWAINKKSTKEDLRAQYFSCLTRIFSKSGSHCYHAYSWYQLYLLAVKSKALPEADRQHLASAVLLSTLAIEPYDRRGPVRCHVCPYLKCAVVRGGNCFRAVCLLFCLKV
jgi:hypothetical protein